MKPKRVLQVIVEQDEAGYYVAECPALRACYAQGKTYEEVLINIKDVIGLCLEDLKAKPEEDFTLEVVERGSVAKTPPIAGEDCARFQFGIGTLLAIAFLHAVLFAVLRPYFAVLRPLGSPPLVIFEFALFLTSVGLGQKLLYKGQQKLKASIVVGVCFFVGLFIFCFIEAGICYLCGIPLAGAYRPFAPFDPIEGAIGGVIFGCVFGPPVAGVLWAVDKLRNQWDKSRGRG